MDWAVLDAYGWADLKPTCKFLLDYEEDEDEDESGGRHRKKSWRYCWPDDFRDEVLARLLEHNRQRAEEERLSGVAAEAKPKKPRKRRRARSLMWISHACSDTPTPKGVTPDILESAGNPVDSIHERKANGASRILDQRAGRRQAARSASGG